jgi:hypothetical protein
MPGIDAIAEGGGTNETSAFGIGAPSRLITRPLTAEVCAEAPHANNEITTVVTPTRTLSI